VIFLFEVGAYGVLQNQEVENCQNPPSLPHAIATQLLPVDGLGLQVQIGREHPLREIVSPVQQKVNRATFSESKMQCDGEKGEKK